MSEDCLSLNVWTPQEESSAKLPVLVWIHGGGFLGGSSSAPIYEGRSLAQHGIVVVTINYRVGVLGFLAHPDLTSEAGSSGNYGLMDQIAALRWVRRNIGQFGGDPLRVTLAGQSAGAASAHHLLAADEADGLFQRVIAESGSGMGLPVASLAEAEAIGTKIATAAGAKDIAALRALPADQLMQATHARTLGEAGGRFAPIRDGHILRDSAVPRSDVPVLTGMNADENSATDPAWLTADAEALASLLARSFGGAAARFAPLYPSSEPRDSARGLLRDRGLAALTAWYEARPPAAAVYGYLFSHVQPAPAPARFGAFHSSEIPYVFGTLDAAGGPFSPFDRALSEVMGRYWAAFVTSGQPVADDAPAWPDLSSGDLMIFAEGAPVPLPALTSQKSRAYRAFTAEGGKLGLFSPD